MKTYNFNTKPSKTQEKQLSSLWQMYLYCIERSQMSAAGLYRRRYNYRFDKLFTHK